MLMHGLWQESPIVFLLAPFMLFLPALNVDNRWGSGTAGLWAVASLIALYNPMVFAGCLIKLILASAGDAVVSRGVFGGLSEELSGVWSAARAADPFDVAMRLRMLDWACLMTVLVTLYALEGYYCRSQWMGDIASFVATLGGPVPMIAALTLLPGLHADSPDCVPGFRSFAALGKRSRTHHSTSSTQMTQMTQMTESAACDVATEPCCPSPQDVIMPAVCVLSVLVNAVAWHLWAPNQSCARLSDLLFPPGVFSTFATYSLVGAYLAFLVIIWAQCPSIAAVRRSLNDLTSAQNVSTVIHLFISYVVACIGLLNVSVAFSLWLMFCSRRCKHL